MTDASTPSPPPTPDAQTPDAPADAPMDHAPAASATVDGAAPAPVMPPPTPAPVSTNSRLIGLLVLALIGLSALYVWQKLAGKPDTTRVATACVSARPHFAAFERCLLGSPLAGEESAAQRLRNIVLANETLVPEADWPRRCAPSLQRAIDVLNPVRKEDPRVDRLVASLFSVRIAVTGGRAPTGIDSLWEAAARVQVTGGTASADAPAARAPLRPLTAREATAALIGPRHQRVLHVDRDRVLLAGPAVRMCRVDATRVACLDGAVPAPTTGVVLAPSAPASGATRAADLVVLRAHGAPARVVDTAGWTEIAAPERLYAAYAQRGGVSLVRAGAARGGAPSSSIVIESVAIESLAAGAALTPATLELRIPLSPVSAPQIAAGFVHYSYADLRAPAPRAPPEPPRVGIGVTWLADDVSAPRVPQLPLWLPSLPVQVLGCALTSGRALAFITATIVDGAEPQPRATEVHFYDAAGAHTATVTGRLPGTAAVIDCIGDRVALVARKQVATDARRGIQLAGLTCSADGCESSSAAVARMNDVPDVVTLGGGEVLAVYRTAASGGLRARIAPLALLATARELVITDEAPYGGIESSHRWLVRDGDGALLVLETRAGIVALRISADGALMLLRP